jgi:gamma-glutamyltranspeptidase / glutathione hydrolase
VSSGGPGARRAVRGAVAAGHELTAQAGADALARGGNAFDAIVAAGAMSWAAEPALTAPCGGGFVLVRPAADGRCRLLDCFTAIPGRNLPASRRVGEVDAVSVPFDEQTTQVFHIGAAACAVPGVVPGLGALHRRFGRLPWRSLLHPAAEAADRGVVTNRGQEAVFLAIEAVMTHTAEARRLFAPGGRYVREGDVIRQPELARSIAQIAEHGPEAMRSGELARAMVDHQAATGGPLTADDLLAYRPVWRRALAAGFRGHDLHTNPPPSSGGSLIAYMLAVLDAAGAPPAPGEARTLVALAETMRAAARTRDRRFERLLHRGGLPAHLLSPESVERGREAVERALAGVPSPAPAIRADPGTTHISVVDGDGNAAAFTASNGCHSGVVVPGVGLHLNNMMGEEDLAAGRHRGPGGRLTSMQAPSILDRDGRLRLVVGSSGSNRLRSAITQVIVNVVDHSMPVAEAVSSPRVHVEGDRLDCEGGIDPREIERLQTWGENVNRFGGLNLYFGGANAVTLDSGGRLEAAGDPRRDCAAVVL